MKRKKSPPKWADLFLAWFCAEELLEEIQGDLHEAYYYRLDSLGERQANRQYIKDVFQFFRPYAFEKYSRAKQFLPMHNNYYKIALRNILHRKGFTAINMLGLTFGISAVVLIGLFLNNEYTYDQSTPDHERIFRLMNGYRDQVYTPMSFHDSSTPEGQKRLVNHINNYEEVQTACHFILSESDIGGRDKYFVEVEGQRFVADNLLNTNTGKEFQEIFPQKFLIGNPEGAFNRSNQILLTEKLAKKWFGNNWQSKDLLGKIMKVQSVNYELVGVVEEQPNNVHFNFDWLIYKDTLSSWGAYTYFKMKPDYDMLAIESRFSSEVDLVYPGYSEDPLQKGIQVLPLTDIHFTKGNLYELKPTANKTYLNTFGIVGLVILLIVLTNYTNLSIAMYADRQKELGVRKVMGAQSSDITFQLLAEAVILALLCFPFCLLLLWFVLPYFSELMNIGWDSYLLMQGKTLLFLFGMLLLSRILNAIYPALSKNKKSMINLFGKRINQSLGNRYLNFRNVLVTSQFFMMVTLLSITFFIYQQMNFVNNIDLGYQKENILHFNIDGVEKYKALKKELLNFPEIKAVGANGLPGSDMYNQTTYKIKDTDVTLADGTFQYLDLGSVKALELDCKACKELEKGKKQIFLINQTAAEKLSKIKGITPEELIGETLISEPEFENERYGFGIPYVIDGIMDDYKFFSLKYPNQSLLIRIRPEAVYTYSMMVSSTTDDWNSTIQKIETAYGKVESTRPFSFGFLDDRINKLYAAERRSGVLMAGLSLLAIILALTGLAGVVSYIIHSREKEISIRKVLGASVGNILYFFNKEFLMLMGIATLIAGPISIMLAIQWLNSFAFHIEPSIWVIALAGLIMLLLVSVLVSVRSLSAATQNPQVVLRNNQS
ncbi:MAG: permease prefix domain 2-containing transporter [Saprospiraceae bacterium]